MNFHTDLATPHRQSGFSLIELMIGITLGLLVVAGITVVFVNSSRARAEIEKTSQQIENGRYATQTLVDEIRMAGYYGELNPTVSIVATPTAKPDACATDAASLTAALALPIQGYDAPDSAVATLPASCTAGGISDMKPGTDVLVIRRASTCIAGSAGCDAADYAKYTYFQVNRCATSPTPHVDYVVDTDPTHFTALKNMDCATTASVRSYYTRIYYIANNNKANDGIPTLKMADMASGAFTITPLVAGIEQLQLEYGIDTNGDGSPDVYTSDPGTYGACAGAACQTNWRNVTAMKIHILARNTQSTVGYEDKRSYVLGSTTVAADNAPYKRHVYTTMVRLMNIAGRLE